MQASVNAVDMSGQAPSPRCSVCKLFIPAWDNHMRCFAHWEHDCSQADPCEACVSWNSQTWNLVQQSLTKRALRTQKREEKRALEREYSQRGEKVADPSCDLSGSFPDAGNVEGSDKFKGVWALLQETREYNAAAILEGKKASSLPKKRKLKRKSEKVYNDSEESMYVSDLYSSSKKQRGAGKLSAKESAETARESPSESVGDTPSRRKQTGECGEESQGECGQPVRDTADAYTSKPGGVAVPPLAGARSAPTDQWSRAPMAAPVEVRRSMEGTTRSRPAPEAVQSPASGDSHIIRPGRRGFSSGYLGSGRSPLSMENLSVVSTVEGNHDVGGVHVYTGAPVHGVQTPRTPG